MMLTAMAVAASLAGASTPAVNEVIAFRAGDALVVDAANQPLFRTSRDYLLKMARNPAGQVVRYDPLARRVLVSSVGPEYWLRCADLVPMQASCPALPPRPATRSIKIPRGDGSDPGVAARGLPACPGDPRCPKSD
jgi:hypothetical protein